MPEYRESLISAKLIQYFLEKEAHPEDQDALLVQNLWVDPTDAEVRNAPGGSRIADGYVYVLKDNTNVLRGQRNSQKPVYPPQYSNQGVPIVQQGLRLTGVNFSPRNVILNLEKIWVQVVISHFYVTLLSLFIVV